MNNTGKNCRDRDETKTEQDDNTCDFEGCDDETYIRAANGRFCDDDHAIADRNGWGADELSEFEVAYDGEEGTWRAPSEEIAENQFRAHVWAVRE